MNAPRPKGITPSSTLGMLVLAAAAGLTALEYPRIALSVHRLLSGEGGDGSGLGLVRDRYVFPAAAAFLIALFLGGLLAARRGRHAMRGVILAGWLVLVAGVVAVTQWYFHAPGRTGPGGALPAATVVHPMAEQMRRLGVAEALVIASQAVDDQPVWSPDGRYLAANVDGKWVGVEPDSLQLGVGEWHDRQPIGIVESARATVPLTEANVREWRGGARSDSRSITARDGTRFELRPEGLGIRFVVTGRDSVAKTRWTTSMENCHSLALSPDDVYVAFICETNGVIVARP